MFPVKRPGAPEVQKDRAESEQTGLQRQGARGQGRKDCEDKLSNSSWRFSICVWWLPPRSDLHGLPGIGAEGGFTRNVADGQTRPGQAAKGFL